MEKPHIEAQAWDSLSRLLDEALEQPPDTLESWLDGLPDEAGLLKPRLRELLAGAALIESGDFLETLPMF
jgi:hypothetical protein